jgi:hypothetical protein
VEKSLWRSTKSRALSPLPMMPGMFSSMAKARRGSSQAPASRERRRAKGTRPMELQSAGSRVPTARLMDMMQLAAARVT